ncbi:hypothetical protein ACPOL_4740 [Acidisarcina polymorpha]|uniref:Uncharacterized protein n=2 Tax=Acidisarcina polymorpha TaxID=2211140 RepID=A0A2Z5G4H4_9BACT|nr:hypothetical protein ACPOL_4740 [Acidisarcina polymorpha]
MREVRSTAKLQGWTTVAVVLVMGIALGVTGSYFLFIRDLGNIDDRLETIQQQIATPAPAPETKPAGKPGKAHPSH